MLYIRGFCLGAAVDKPSRISKVLSARCCDIVILKHNSQGGGKKTVGMSGRVDGPASALTCLSFAVCCVFDAGESTSMVCLVDGRRQEGPSTPGTKLAVPVHSNVGGYPFEGDYIMHKIYVPSHVRLFLGSALPPNLVAA